MLSQDANDRCLSHELGSDLRGTLKSRSVEGPSSIMAHQPAVFLALKNFLSYLRGNGVLVRSDNTSVVSYINHQGGLRSRPLCKLACQILLWSQGKLLSLRAAYIPGVHNIGADILSRQGMRLEAPPRGGGADIEGVRPGTSGSVCISRDISLSTLVLSHTSSSSWIGCDGADVAEASSVCIYPNALLPGVLERVRRVLLLLIAPRWPGRVGFPDIISLRDRPPLELPVRRDLLSHAVGLIFHPQPELWKLWA